MAETKVTQARRAGKTSTKGLSDFREKHDRSYIVPKRIKETFEEMVAERESQAPGKGDEAWEYDGEFISRSRLAAREVSEYSHNFTDHIVELGTTREGRGKKIWCARVKTAKKLRETLGQSDT